MKFCEWFTKQADRDFADQNTQKGFLSGEETGFLFIIDDYDIATVSGKQCYNCAFEMQKNDGQIITKEIRPSLEYIKKNCRRIKFDNLEIDYKMEFGIKLNEFISKLPNKVKAYRKYLFVKP